MGQQVIIIEASGTFDLERIKKIVQSANESGLEILQASVRYAGETHFTHGTGDSLVRLLADMGKVVALEKKEAPLETAGTAPEGITLETVLDEVKAHHEAFRKFVAYEKKDDKGAKESKPRGKKEVPAAPATTGTEGTGNPPPEPTETGTTHAAPDGNPPPSTGDAPEPEQSQSTGNEES